MKDGMGQWVKVIEPDRRVDLSKEEAVVSFFNNGGRVRAGGYKNFRIDFFDGNLNKARTLSAKNDFEKVIEVKRGSFVYVSFSLVMKERVAVEKARVDVDEDSRELLADSLTLEA